MTPDRLAAIHGQCFVVPRPWTQDEFAALLDSPHVFLLIGSDGFLLGRVVADEAELLTLAIALEQRRRGIARDLVTEFAATSRMRGAAQGFLEVAADNAPARALYRATGWQEAGRRRRYYGPGLDAIVMTLDLGGDQQGG